MNKTFLLDFTVAILVSIAIAFIFIYGLPAMFNQMKGEREPGYQFVTRG